MKGNDLAACLVIALGVGGTIIGSLLAPVNEPVTLPAVNPQPVMMETGANARADTHRGDRAFFRDRRRPDPRRYFLAGERTRRRPLRF